MSSTLRIGSYPLDDRTRDRIGAEIADRTTGGDLVPDADEAILARIGAYALERHLPAEIRQAVRRYRVTGQHALRLTNLPRQEFPPTPVTGFGSEPALAVVNALHLGLLQMLGLAPFAVSYENEGRLIRNVVPNPAAAGTTSSWGADAEFFWHTDNPHLPFGQPGTDPRRYVPRYLSFYAVRNAEQVPTELLALEDVVAQVAPATLADLSAPLFRVGAPASNEVGPDGQRAALTATAVLVRDDSGHDLVRFDRGTTVGLHPAADAALAEWTKVLQEPPSVALVLEPGDFLLFDNYRVLHRRGAFSPAPWPTARWLRRCYAS